VEDPTLRIPQRLRRPLVTGLATGNYNAQFRTYNLELLLCANVALQVGRSVGAGPLFKASNLRVRASNAIRPSSKQLDSTRSAIQHATLVDGLVAVPRVAQQLSRHATVSMADVERKRHPAPRLVGEVSAAPGILAALRALLSSALPLFSRELSLGPWDQRAVAFLLLLVLCRHANTYRLVRRPS
jgi:hypothetical protein